MSSNPIVYIFWVKLRLAKKQITSEQLYLWSASIDLIENYQSYLEKKILVLVNSILCMIIFKSKVILEVDCGLYLLTSSILNLLIMIIFSWKYFILLFSQMTLISNRKFLLLHCYSTHLSCHFCYFCFIIEILQIRTQKKYSSPSNFYSTQISLSNITLSIIFIGIRRMCNTCVNRRLHVRIYLIFFCISSL